MSAFPVLSKEHGYLILSSSGACELNAPRRVGARRNDAVLELLHLHSHEATLAMLWKGACLRGSFAAPLPLARRIVRPGCDSSQHSPLPSSLPS